MALQASFHRCSAAQLLHHPFITRGDSGLSQVASLNLPTEPPTPTAQPRISPPWLDSPCNSPDETSPGYRAATIATSRPQAPRPGPRQSPFFHQECGGVIGRWQHPFGAFKRQPGLALGHLIPFQQHVSQEKDALSSKGPAPLHQRPPLAHSISLSNRTARANGAAGPSLAAPVAPTEQSLPAIQSRHGLPLPGPQGKARLFLQPAYSAPLRESGGRLMMPFHESVMLMHQAFGRSTHGAVQKLLVDARQHGRNREVGLLKPPPLHLPLIST